ncbi:MAG TPA: sugar phosphate isomerase/epimerase family protein [Limnochordia bacterium]|nr:sugar phosphate isomerase/epimerase family protein [Limnochordia bacterium]
MKWVLNTYQTCQDWPVEKIIAVCLDAGYAGVEFLMDFKQAHGVEADASPEHVDAVAKQVKAAGLIVASLTSCVTFDSPDAAVRQSKIDQARRVIDHAARIGCDHVRVLGDRLPAGEAERQQTIKHISEAIGVLAEHAAPHGIAVAMEMHGDFTDPELARQVARGAGRPNVGLVFNSQWRVGAPSGWALPAGAPSIKPLYDLTGLFFTSVHTHGMERPDERGYYHELFRLLKRDGYAGYVSNECAYRGPDPEKVLRLYTALFESFIAD